MTQSTMLAELGLGAIDLEVFPPLRVLAADDNAYNREILRCLLGLVGVQPDLVEDGEALLESWSSGRHDIILTDIEMPRMSGMGAAKEIRLREARLGSNPIPIVAITANADTYSTELFKTHGVTAVVPKPIRPRMLFVTILDALAQQSAPAQQRDEGRKRTRRR